LITENLSTLKIHKLTQEQYERELKAGNIDEAALYLTPDDSYGSSSDTNPFTKTLIWENASPNSDFPAQDVILNGITYNELLDSYDGIEIAFTNSGGELYTTGVLPLDDMLGEIGELSSQISRSSITANTYGICCRSFSFSGDDEYLLVTFGSGFTKYYNDDIKVQEHLFVPFRIYAVRGGLV